MAHWNLEATEIKGSLVQVLHKASAQTSESSNLFVLLLYVPSQQLWSWQDRQFM